LITLPRKSRKDALGALDHIISRGIEAPRSPDGGIGAIHFEKKEKNHHEKSKARA